MEGHVSASFWSDEDRWFVARSFGLGYSLNLKYVAKRLGWIKTPSLAADSLPAGTRPQRKAADADAKTPEERLRQRIDESKYEDAG